MGDLGLPGSVVEMIDDAPQKNLWEVRKAGLNIMMSLKGDGKPVSFIEDCAVPLEHLAEYTDAPDPGVPQARQQGHLVRPCLGGHTACAPDPGHATRRRREDASHRRRGLCAGAQVQGRLQRRTRRRPVPGRVDRMAVRAARSRRRSARSSSSWTRTIC
jgi:FAD/FMN-containing dehydrogenase